MKNSHFRLFGGLGTVVVLAISLATPVTAGAKVSPAQKAYEAKEAAATAKVVASEGAMDRYLNAEYAAENKVTQLIAEGARTSIVNAEKRVALKDGGAYGRARNAWYATQDTLTQLAAQGPSLLKALCTFSDAGLVIDVAEIEVEGATGQLEAVPATIVIDAATSVACSVLGAS